MLVIREGTIDDAEGKGTVHYQSWNETYTGLIDQKYLDSRSLAKCIEIAKKYPDNTLVAEVNKNIVGFACYCPYRDEDLLNACEVTAIYVLQEYQKMNIGKRLLEACLNKLTGFDLVAVWVLNTNINAINFYHYMGFRADSKTKEVNLSDDVTIRVIRMIKYLIS